MCQEIPFCGESFIMYMLCRFCQHLPVQRVVESQFILLQVIDYVFRYRNGNFFPFLIGNVAQYFLSVAYYHLQDKALVFVEFLSFFSLLWDIRYVFGSFRWKRCTTVRHFSIHGIRRHVFRVGWLHSVGKRCLCSVAGCIILSCFPVSLFRLLLSLRFASFGNFRNQQFVFYTKQLATFFNIYIADNCFRNNRYTLYKITD